MEDVFFAVLFDAVFLDAVFFVALLDVRGLDSRALAALLVAGRPAAVAAASVLATTGVMWLERFRMRNAWLRERGRIRFQVVPSSTNARHTLSSPAVSPSRTSALATAEFAA